MKQTILFLSLFFSVCNLFAQNANEAKAAYLLAEESYGKGDYKAAVDYLQQAKKSLGAPNCKLLYLEILSTKELLAKDSLAARKLMPLVEVFERSADYKDFNEEKVLEITKIKIVLKGELDKLAAAEQKRRALRAALKTAFDEEFATALPFGITIDELDAKAPELQVKDWKSEEIAGRTVYYPSHVSLLRDETKNLQPFIVVEKSGMELLNRPFSVITNNGKITTYRIQLKYTDKKIDKNLRDASLREARSIIDQYKQKMPVPPETLSGDVKDGSYYEYYTWRLDKRLIGLYLVYFPKAQAPVVKLVKSVGQAL